MSTLVLKLNRMVFDPPKADSTPVCTAQASQPAQIKLLSRKPTLFDNLVAIAFVLCVAGLVWLLWDQQRLLR